MSEVQEFSSMNDEGDLTGRGFADVVRGLKIIQLACHKRAVSKGWWESGERNMGEMIALMHSELSEALESYRNSEPLLWYRHDDNCCLDMSATMPQVGDSIGKPEGLASEFADVLIRIFDTCERLEIPLTQALLDKHAYNGTRSYRHGGKKA
jgi:NTP pyrophosphatase (non-canonical NTP hydrolase)